MLAGIPSPPEPDGFFGGEVLSLGPEAAGREVVITYTRSRYDRSTRGQAVGSYRYQ